MAGVVVLFHSSYGHTQRMAQSVADGADADLVAIDADGQLSASQWQLLDAADAIVLGAPTYMGMVSWQFKKMADASSQRWLAGAWRDKLAAGFTCSGHPSGDKLASLQYLFTFAMQHGMVWVGQAQQNDGRINRLGAFMGAMAYSASDEAAQAMSTGDLETARLLGERVLRTARALRAGRTGATSAPPG